MTVTELLEPVWREASLWPSTLAGLKSSASSNRQQNKFEKVKCGKNISQQSRRLRCTPLTFERVVHGPGVRVGETGPQFQFSNLLTAIHHKLVKILGFLSESKNIPSSTSQLHSRLVFWSLTITRAINSLLSERSTTMWLPLEWKKSARILSTN